MARIANRKTIEAKSSDYLLVTTVTAESVGGECRDWEVWLRVGSSQGDWKNYYVRTDARRSEIPRRTFHLSHNGDRFAKSKDFLAAQMQTPNLLDQIEMALMGR